MNVIVEPLKDKDVVVVHIPNHSAVYDPHQKDPVKRVYLTPGDDMTMALAVGMRSYDVRLRVMPPDSPPDPTLVANMRSWLAEHFGIELNDAQALSLARISNGLEAEPPKAKSGSKKR